MPLRFMRAPRYFFETPIGEEGGGGGEESGETSEARQKFLDERPEFLAEKFWPSDGNADPMALLEAVSNSYGELESRQGMKEVDLRNELKQEVEREMFDGVPTDITGYELGLPEDLPVQLDPESPLLTDFREVAHKHKLPQEAVNEIMALYGKTILETLPDEQEEKQKIGEDFDGRLERMTGVFKAKLSDEQFAAAQNLFMDADTFKLMEHFSGLMGGSAQHSAFDGGVPPLSDADTEQMKSELTELQGSDAYWGTSQNPSEVERVRRRVTELNDKLYGTQTRKRRSDGTLS